jgi:hypothetical protein
VVAYETRFEAQQQRHDPYPSGEHALPPLNYSPGNQAADRPAGLGYSRVDGRRDDQVLVAMRNGVLLRMREMNTRHGMHAFDLRSGADALGPHSVAFLYRDADGAIRAATRLFRDDTEVRHLPTLLWTLAQIARQYVERGGFDPRTVMAHRHDKMSPQAQYIGVGVSSLNTLAGDWVDIRSRIESALQVAGSSYTRLVDGSRMILDRGGQYGIAGDTYSSHPLEAGNTFGYTSFRALYSRPGGSDDETWRAMDALHQQIWHGIEMMAQRMGRRRR